jgi:hypothetical protein
LQKKITVRRPKINYGWEAEGMDFGLPKVLVDNSSAVEGCEEAKAVLFKSKKNCSITCFTLQ